MWVCRHRLMIDGSWSGWVCDREITFVLIWSPWKSLPDELFSMKMFLSPLNTVCYMCLTLQIGVFRQWKGSETAWLIERWLGREVRLGCIIPREEAEEASLGCATRWPITVCVPCLTCRQHQASDRPPGSASYIMQVHPTRAEQNWTEGDSWISIRFGDLVNGEVPQFES